MDTQDTLYDKTSSEQLPCCFFTQITGPLSPNSPKPLFLYFLNSFLSLLICLFVSSHVYKHRHATHMESEDRQFVQSGLSFYHVGPKD